MTSKYSEIFKSDDITDTLEDIKPGKGLDANNMHPHLHLKIQTWVIMLFLFQDIIHRDPQTSLGVLQSVFF